MPQTRKPKAKTVTHAAKAHFPRDSAKQKLASAEKAKPIEQYDHKAKQRVNNPPVGLVTPATDADLGRKTYAYDSHLDPQLVWAGKAEHTSFEVPTVSLHVHERMDPRTIIEAVRRSPLPKGEGVGVRESPAPYQPSLFTSITENPPLREAVEFYKHKHGWSNRLIAGDSLLVMNSLLEKEGLAGQVQMIYIDPPYGIKYGSNFQPFVNKHDVKDGKDEDLSQEPEMVKAFRDTWDLDIHSYLTYLRDRLLLAHELLSETGSLFVQISDENVHRVRLLLDEVFGNQNYVALISFTKTSGQTKSNFLPIGSDYLLSYAKNRHEMKYRQLFTPKVLGGEGSKEHRNVELPDGSSRALTPEETINPSILPNGSRIYATGPIVSAGYSPAGSEDIELEWEGEKYTLRCGPNRHWTVGVEGTRHLWEIGRLMRREGLRIFKRYFDDFAYSPITNTWVDTRGETEMNYVVQTSGTVIERCILMATDPGDLVLDPTCGSGTTAFIAEQMGRRWITCDTSRVAVTLTKQRLLTALFDYYQLAQSEEGVDSGFKYKTVPHVKLGALAHDEPSHPETLYDQPLKDNSKARVTGPFTVEAVPAPTARPIGEIETEPASDASVARSGETLRQAQWRDELFHTGIRAKGGQKIEFTRVEPLPGTRWLHADAETREATPQRAVVSFGSEFAPLEQRQVELAIEEAGHLVPKPKLVVFAAFHFDPEAGKDIDETQWPGLTLLKAQMNTDLLTEDLKKKRASNESFWLIGQPDVTLESIKTGEHKGKYRIEVHGFDYYNPKTGAIESGGKEQIAMWLLDPDYDGRSLFPRQVFFPMAGEKDGWARLARNLKAEIDEDLIEQYRDTVSLPFDPGPHKRVAVKIVDDRGIESLKLIEVD